MGFNSGFKGLNVKLRWQEVNLCNDEGLTHLIQKINGLVVPLEN